MDMRGYLVTVIDVQNPLLMDEAIPFMKYVSMEMT